MQSRSLRRAVVFGEALIDVFPDAELVAGAPLHVAAHLAATGWKVDFITRIGADRAGGRVVATLESLGIEPWLVEMDHDLATGRAKVLRKGGFEIQSPAAYDEIDGPRVMREHSLFCYGTLAARADISRRTLIRLLSSSSGLRALDVNLRSPHFSRGVLTALVSRAQLIKLTDEELTQVAGLLRIPAHPAAFFAASKSLSWLCVTKGAQGAELFSSTGDTWSVPAPPAEVVDAVGAGDAFFARLAGALAAGFSEEAALRAATAAAGDVLSHRGGLPRRSEPIT